MMAKITHENIRKVIQHLPEIYNMEIKQASIKYDENVGIFFSKYPSEDDKTVKVPIDFKTLYKQNGKRRSLKDIDEYLYPILNKWVESLGKQEVKGTRVRPRNEQELNSMTEEQVNKIIKPLIWVKDKGGTDASVIFGTTNPLNKYKPKSSTDIEKILPIALYEYNEKHGINKRYSIALDSETGLFCMFAYEGHLYDLYQAAEALNEYTKK